MRQAEGQPQSETPVEEPTQPQAPVEEPPVEEPVGTEEQPVETPVETAEFDPDDLDAVVDEATLLKRYHVPKKIVAEIAEREKQRGQLVEGVRKAGGQPGLEFAQQFNSILFGKQNPGPEDAEKAFDLLVLPEHGGGIKLVREMGKHFVVTSLYDDTPGKDGVPLGKSFANDLIREEYGVQADGKTPYDLDTVNALVQLHKSLGVDAEGKPLPLEALERLVWAKGQGHLDDEFISNEYNEYQENRKREPTPEEKKLREENEKFRKELEATKVDREREATESKARYERDRARYKTEATNWTRDAIMAKVMPEAIKYGWAQNEGETDEAKKEWGETVSDSINSKLEKSADFKAIEQMIDDGEAFTASGHPTPKLKGKIESLQYSALAMFRRKVRTLAPQIKFAATTSRSAQLANNNGRNGQQPAQEPPPLQVQQPQKPAVRKSTEELSAENAERLRKRMAEIQAGAL